VAKVFQGEVVDFCPDILPLGSFLTEVCFMVRKFLLLWLLWALPACGTHSALGIGYEAETNFSLPSDIPHQIDAAWLRVMRLLDVCEVPLGARVDDLRARWFVWVHDGAIEYEGRRYYGLTFPDDLRTRVALLDGRIPAAAHELFHAVVTESGLDVNGDANHTHPCWPMMDGDTR
jgi:hypothetical protein